MLKVILLFILGFLLYCFYLFMKAIWEAANEGDSEARDRYIEKLRKTPRKEDV